MFTAASQYGATPQLPQLSASPLQGAMADDIGGGFRALVSPRNPLLIFGAILAFTVGAIGVAGSARLGKGTVSVAVGKA